MSADERRRAILDCAARLFRHYGHAKTTVADIAREAEMGVGTVYLVFPSKEAIVEELSSSAHDRVLHAMRLVAEERAHEPLTERLTGVLEMRVTMFQRFAEEGQHACELVHCKSGPVKSVQARFRREEAAILQGVLDHARRVGELAPCDIARTVGLVQRAYATLSPPWIYEEDPDEIRRAARDMCRLLLHGLCARPHALQASTSAANDRAEQSKPARRSARRAR